MNSSILHLSTYELNSTNYRNKTYINQIFSHFIQGPMKLARLPESSENEPQKTKKSMNQIHRLEDTLTPKTVYYVPVQMKFKLMNIDKLALSEETA